jgi:hypothetical protein
MASRGLTDSDGKHPSRSSSEIALNMLRCTLRKNLLILRHFVNKSHHLQAAELTTMMDELLHHCLRELSFDGDLGEFLNVVNNLSHFLCRNSKVLAGGEFEPPLRLMIKKYTIPGIASPRVRLNVTTEMVIS